MGRIVVPFAHMVGKAEEGAGSVAAPLDTGDTGDTIVGDTVVAGDVAARIAGFLIDAVIVTFASLVLLTLLGFLHGPVVEVRSSGGLADRVEVDAARFAVDTVCTTLLAATYFAGSWVRRGHTIGQRAVGLEVVSAGDATAALGTGRAIVRFFSLGAPLWIIAGFVAGNARLVLWLLALAWYVVLAVSVAAGSATQGVHDRIAGSVVVRHVTPLLGHGTRADREATA